MRIISGKYRGMKLAGFSGTDIRPTADRVKESLFNIIQAKVANSTVLDLFCGCGNLGIECLSRGAASVHFNDVSRESVAVLKKNLLRISTEAAVKITVADYADCLKMAERYDLVFIDPPYRLDIGIKALEIIGRNGLLNSGGIAVFERDRAFDGEIQGLEIYDERKYGITYLSFFRPKERQ